MKKVFIIIQICAISCILFAGCASSNQPEREVPEMYSDDEDSTAEPEMGDSEQSTNEPQSDNNQVEVIVDDATNEGQVISDEAALEGVVNYCYSENPDLKQMVADDQYPIYWDISSSDVSEVVVVYRSYTGAFEYYYVDKNTGDTRITEYVPVIMDSEQPTDRSLNVKDYINN